MLVCLLLLFFIRDNYLAPGLIDDGGDDSFLDFVRFDDADYEYEYENEEELAIQLPKTIRNAK